MRMIPGKSRCPVSALSVNTDMTGDFEAKSIQSIPQQLYYPYNQI